VNGDQGALFPRPTARQAAQLFGGEHQRLLAEDVQRPREGLADEHAVRGRGMQMSTKSAGSRDRRSSGVSYQWDVGKLERKRFAALRPASQAATIFASERACHPRQMAEEWRRFRRR
jgi:hypothetical protein